jgi:medium-chain acyl-[acyl-carrier-protein] hydrolase
MTLPFVFFGYSLGALLSFELTRHLRRHVMPIPKHLFVAAHRAPQLARRTETIHNLHGADFIQALHRLGGTPEAVLQNQELMEMMSPMLRADFQVYETYGYKNESPLACPITAFGGELDRTVSEAELAAWKEQTSGTFQLRMLPGGHFFLQSSQDLLIQSVAQHLH